MPFFTEDARNIRVIPLGEWLDCVANGPNDRNGSARIVLPMIQRGFIWKPAQIIDLWDTLLRGMPIGSLMASELPANYRWISLLDRQLGDGGDCLGLIDGQQRTLAMLIGWIAPEKSILDRRLWVDFADEPGAGHLLRLRVTTPNQPFGFRRDSPNTKLPLGIRRLAKIDYFKKQENQVAATPDGQRADKPLRPDYLQAQPWSDRPSLAMDMRELVSLWKKQEDRKAWETAVFESLKRIGVTHDTQAQGTASQVWERAKRNVRRLGDGLKWLLAAEIAVLRVDGALFEPTDAETDNKEASLELPLAVLFKRIGSNGSELSNDDYAYSILKQIVPDVHTLVESLYDPREGAQVARLISATDLVMTALRLAAASFTTRGNAGDPAIPDKTTRSNVGDPARPSKEEFHRLIRRDNFLETDFLPLLRKDFLKSWFQLLLNALQYTSDRNPLGLARHLFPHLGRPLVQVLLRLAQTGYLCEKPSPVRSKDLIRLCLFWLVCVTDQDKASRIAYKRLAEPTDSHFQHDDLGYAIAREMVSNRAAVALENPQDIEDYPGLAFVRDETDKVVGESRFRPHSDHERDHKLCGFYRQRWWRPWTHRHPVLLWLQRAYVDKIPGEPLAGWDEDTPYDYDHILPSAHWSDWTGTSRSISALPSHCEKAGEYGVTGNGIGNVRVWDASDNRSDSEKPPAAKLRCSESDRNTVGQGILIDSAVAPDHLQLWIDCSASESCPDDNRYWDKNRALFFQDAVQRRAFKLYQRFFDDLGFDAWKEIVGSGGKPANTRSAEADDAVMSDTLSSARQ